MSIPTRRLPHLAAALLLALLASAEAQDGPRFGGERFRRFRDGGFRRGGFGSGLGLLGPEERERVAELVLAIPDDVASRRVEWLYDTYLQASDQLQSSDLGALPDPMRLGAFFDSRCMEHVARELPVWLEARNDGARADEIVERTQSVPRPCVAMAVDVLEKGVGAVRERWQEKWAERAERYGVYLSLPEESGAGDGEWPRESESEVVYEEGHEEGYVDEPVDEVAPSEATRSPSPSPSPEPSREPSREPTPEPTPAPPPEPTPEPPTAPSPEPPPPPPPSPTPTPELEPPPPTPTPWLPAAAGGGLVFAALLGWFLGQRRTPSTAASPGPPASPLDAELDSALALLSKGDDEGAATRLQALLASAGASAPPRLRWGLAVAFLARGQTPLALPHVGELRGTRLPLRQLYQLATALESAGVGEEAVRLYRSILSRDLQFRDVAARVEKLTSQATRLPAHLLKDLPARYSSPSTLGRGGMASVLAVTDQVLRRRVALKRPDSRVISEEELRSRFLREARVLATVVHPNVIRVFDVVAGPTPFYTMELHEGLTLSEVITEEAPLSPARVLELVQPLAEALAACHEAGVVHRDLKPGNVLLDSEGRPVLADFGLAFTGDDTEITRTGVVPGTIAYMAPEQAKGARPSPSFDIWAFGVILHQLLLAQRPVAGKPATTPGDCPPGLARLLTDCLALDPTERPADGGELARRLADLAGTTRARDEDLIAFAAEFGELVWGELHSLKNRRNVAAGGDAEVDGLVARIQGMKRPAGLGQGARTSWQEMVAALEGRDLSGAYGHAMDLLRGFELNAFEVLDPLVTGYRWKGSVRLEIGMPGPACRVADAALARRDLELAVANLIENAIEAGAQSVEVRIDSMEPDQEATLVQVVDDGPGFPDELREKVFRTSFSSRPEGGGTGLMAVGRICKRRGWSVGLAPGSPTTFRMILPAAPH